MRSFKKQSRENGITIFIEKNLRDLTKMLILLICIIYFVRLQRNISNLDYQDFQRLCGQQTFDENHRIAQKNFDNHYKNKVFKFKSTFMSFQDGCADFDYFIYVKMLGSYSKQYEADFAIGVTKRLYETLKQKQKDLQNLKAQDQIFITAKFLEIANDFNYHTLNLIDYENI